MTWVTVCGGSLVFTGSLNMYGKRYVIMAIIIKKLLIGACGDLTQVCLFVLIMFIHSNKK